MEKHVEGFLSQEFPRGLAVRGGDIFPAGTGTGQGSPRSLLCPLLAEGGFAWESLPSPVCLVPTGAGTGPYRYIFSGGFFQMYLPENQKLLLSTFSIPNNSII